VGGGWVGIDSGAARGDYNTSIKKKSAGAAPGGIQGFRGFPEGKQARSTKGDLRGGTLVNGDRT